MQTTFLNAAGVVLFTRDDMEQGNWSQEEYTVNATFPYDAGKVIERGQRLWFRDPATNNPEAFEIKNVTNIEPEHYQQIIAEHIAVSELTDDHINTAEITDKTPQQALTAALAGTLWSVGTVEATNISSADISRGSVWQAVCAIAQNWNVHITPRLTVNAAGAITHRYLDIAQATGVWRGLRLSVDKNMSDSSVTYDDSETLTALYGYGGSVGTASGSGDDTTEELTFANVAWTATSEHPAKPLGQKYIEDPAKTALYGRNGRARFGYYQNSGITDPAILLQKTWEALKATSSPKISIYGTATDLYRLGYADQPIRLHDLAIVDVRETGERFRLQIIKADIDLLDPTATTVEIGAYIQNIIYINRDTNESATSTNYTSVGSGGRRGQSNKQYKESETYSALEKTDNMIGMVVGTRNGQNYIKAGEIGLAINKSGESGQYESTAYINADHINISATKDVHTLAGDIAHDANGRLIIKNAGGMYVERTEAGTTSYFGIWDKGNLTGGVMVQQINGQEGTKLTLKANVVDIPGVVSELAAYDVGVSSFSCAGQAEITGTLYCDADIQAAYGMFGSVTVSPEESEDVFTLNVYDAALSQDGKTLTIYKIDGDTITFSKAATLSVEYGGDAETDTATITVTGTPAENFPSGNTVVGTFTVHQNKLAAYILDGAGTLRARIDNPQYSNGWSAAYGKVDLPTTSSTAQSFTIETPPSTVDGGAEQTTYTMNNAQKNVATVTNPVGTVVARLAHNRYNGGWSAAYGKVSLPTTSSTAQSFTVQTPPSTVDGNADSTTYTMNNAQLNVATVTNPSGTVVARLEHGRYTQGYNAGGKTAWIETVSAVASPEQFTPGTYISPSYVEYGASSATVKDHTWYVPTAWLDVSTSAPAGTHLESTLGYDSIIYVRYQTPKGWDGNKWASGYWKTPKDRWQEGYDEGAKSVSYPYDAYLKCSNKVPTYPGSSIYNYTFTCNGARSSLASIGDEFHMHWK